MKPAIDTQLKYIQPYIRFVNHYEPSCSFIEKERIIYDYELMYVMDGAVKIQYDDTLYHLKKSDIFYFKPGIKNHMIVDYEKHFRTHCIHFDWMPPSPEYDFTAEEFYTHSVLSPNHYEKAELLKTRTNYEPVDFCIPTHIQKAPHEKFAALFAQCYYAFITGNSVSGLRLQSLFLEILAELVSIYSKSDHTVLTHPKIVYAIEYIKENYMQHITAPELAQKYGLSPKYFGTLFKAATGMRVSDFVLDLRIYAAKEMLIGTDMKIDTIAAETGFHNAFYFSKCFKEKEKLSPSNYRNVMTKIQTR